MLEKRYKKKEIIEKGKAKVIAAKYRKDKRGISLTSEEKENYDSNIANDIDPN